MVGVDLKRRCKIFQGEVNFAHLEFCISPVAEGIHVAGIQFYRFDKVCHSPLILFHLSVNQSPVIIGIGVILGGGVKQRFFIGAGLEAGGQGIGIIAHQDDIGVATGTDLAGQGGEFGGIAGLGLDGDEVGTQGKADPLIGQVLVFFQSGIDISIRHVVANKNGDAGRVFEPLFVTEHDRFPAYFEGLLSNANRNR